MKENRKEVIQHILDQHKILLNLKMCDKYSVNKIVFFKKLNLKGFAKPKLDKKIFSSGIHTKWKNRYFFLDL
jgi:hypothetical protein